MIFFSIQIQRIPHEMEPEKLKAVDLVTSKNLMLSMSPDVNYVSK